ncbi:MAG: hypothetical protein J0L92_40895 [Deltaproteobacteria bacterium]|nr:hypothetical protein [Deltaproteobacteria bacterium]
MSVSFSRSSTPVTHTTRFTDALDAVRPELAALDASDLESVNLEIASATVTAIGVVPELRHHREALERRFDRHEADRVEKLELYARAASQAQAAYLAAAGAAPDLQVLSKRCVELRTMLLADATSLVHRKVIAAERLSGLQGPMGFKNQVTDLQQLVSIFEEHWDRIQGISPVRREDLEAAEDAANALFVGMGQREQAPPAVSEAADVRQRAFTLFVRTYDELRRAMSYLRWHEEDVDTIIPSLWAGKAQRKRAAPEPTPEPTPSDEPKKDPERPFGPDFPSPFEDEPTT